MLDRIKTLSLAAAVFGAGALASADAAKASLVDLGGFLPPDAGDIIYTSPNATVTSFGGIIDASTPPSPAPDFFIDFVLSGLLATPAFSLTTPQVLDGIAIDSGWDPDAYEALVDLDDSPLFALVRLTPVVGTGQFDFELGVLGQPANVEVFRLQRDRPDGEIPLPMTAPLLLTALAGVIAAARRRKTS